MDGFVVGAGSALWLGILTSISPCPLATNVAAISFVGRQVGSAQGALLAGLLYTLGRMAAYLVVGALVVGSILSIVDVSNALQTYMNRLLGPLLIITGLVLLEMIHVKSSGRGVGERLQRRVEQGGLWGAAMLGFIFALTFCPVSAALYFGSLIPLAVKHGSTVALPSLYGIGTGLPVFAFALLVTLGARSLGRWFQNLTRFECWARRATGVVFVLVGMYYCLTYIWGITA